MFYVRLHQIEKNRIDKSLSSQCRYLKIELENLQKSFLNNDFMNITVPVEQSLITAILFGRIMIFFLIYIVIYWIEIFLFTTLHDSSVAEILANNRLIEYVSEEIEQLTEKLHLKFTSIVDSKAVAMDGQVKLLWLSLSTPCMQVNALVMEIRV